ncbi:hemagglutinin stalk domain-containing protein [Dioscorea alata]|uniref:Hemagglutinin stalk domain-containing protein n=1 Tax=Dioscorea alata TaxID=55571 RepID=A0ACB7WTD6_DIOAL|nr:hemagglutinin stalk domain-containing protein [Dioscorea alata]
METCNQELKRVEDGLKSLLKEQTEKQVEKYSKELQELKNSQNQAIQDHKEQQIKDMKEVRTMLLNLNPNSSPSSGNIGSVPPMLAANALNSMKTAIIPSRSKKEIAYLKSVRPKLTKLELPKFSGVDLHDWLYKCHQYFEFDETPENMKGRIASLHLESRALQWHQNFIKCRVGGEDVSWNEYVIALNIRFGIELHYDPMSELKNLVQLGSVQTYLDKLDQLLNKVILSEEYIMSFFLSMLKDEIRYTIRMFRPMNLQEVVSLAKLQEAAVENAYKNGRMVHRTAPLLPTPKFAAAGNNPSRERIIGGVVR